MFNKKLERMLYVVTGVLVLAVLVTAITVLPRKNNSGEREFVQVNGDITAANENTSAIADEAMADINIVELNDRYAEGFNRDGSALDDLTIDLKQLSGLDVTEKSVSEAAATAAAPSEAPSEAAVATTSADTDTPETSDQQISSYTYVETVSLDFDTEYEYSSALPEGKEEIWGSGAPGEVQITYLIYQDADGNELWREEQSRTVTKNPISRLIMVGTGQQAAPTTNTTTTTTTTTQWTPAPTDPPTQPSKKPVSNNFAAPGSNSAAWTNLEKISGLITPMGNLNYYNFSDNGDGTITVDGYTFTYNSVSTRRITGYDGLECCLQWGCHNPPINHNTMSGIPAQRGLAAAAFGGLPMGTVIFVEGYGMAVIADRHGVGGELIDVCFSPGDLRAGIADPGLTRRNVYVLNY